ncbi:proline-rich membrane anchor 1 isoform X1 [Pogona vitticeps]|uniref:Proline-rich membrane anchor 1 isoform X1 n=2 Tax=Pogona vitticeps TaxID=103695 RepID=A0A6J0UIB8_9SAUR|nr:proline-rich membrane anchor 1 isoform X2 [Pogona vitticeps]
MEMKNHCRSGCEAKILLSFRQGMLIREVLLLLQCCWPSLLLQWTLHPIWGFIQITHGEPQKSCSKPVAEKVTDSCQQICQCRPPPLPPPPPPPPPPRLLGVSPPTPPSCPPGETWWPGPVIIIAACCTTPVLLFLVFIICYKAIKRKPLRKEENGTSQAEYAMTSAQNNKTVEANNAVV